MKSYIGHYLFTFYIGLIINIIRSVCTERILFLNRTCAHFLPKIKCVLHVRNYYATKVLVC